MPDVLIQLGIIVFLFCVLVEVLEIINGSRGQERKLREQAIIEAWKKEHPDD